MKFFFFFSVFFFQMLGATQAHTPFYAMSELGALLQIHSTFYIYLCSLELTFKWFQPWNIKKQSPKPLEGLSRIIFKDIVKLFGDL